MSTRSSRSSSTSSSSSSSSSSASRFGTSSKSSQWQQKTYLKIPRKHSVSVGILAYAAGAPRNSTVVKKLTRESPAYYSGGYVPPSDTQMFWVTETPNYSSRSSSSSRHHHRGTSGYPGGNIPPGARFVPVRPGAGLRSSTRVHMPVPPAATMSGGAGGGARPIPPPGAVPVFQNGAVGGSGGGVPAGGPRPPAPAVAPAGGA